MVKTWKLDIFLEVASMMVTWWIVPFLPSEWQHGRLVDVSRWLDLEIGHF